MPRAPRRFPAGPAMVSSLLVLAAVVYLLYRTPGDVGRAPAGEGFVRVVSWNMAEEGPAGLSEKAVADLLRESSADAVCLQGLSSDKNAAGIASRLGPDWKVQPVPGPSGRYLVVLAGPRLEVAAYHLVPTPVGDAVALTLRRPGRQSFHVVCVGAAAETGPADPTERYLAAVLAWCDAHPAALTVLAGRVNTDADLGADIRQRLDERFVQVAASEAPAGEIRVGPPTTPVTQGGAITVDTAAGGTATLAVADVAVP
ncbi:MAG TPA: hypothetical protein VM243_19745 [Phycisphaerae bacterium]|nr:hypothetical protein [Phycisphaerae bacterium]